MVFIVASSCDLFFQDYLFISDHLTFEDQNFFRYKISVLLKCNIVLNTDSDSVCVWLYKLSKVLI